MRKKINNIINFVKGINVKYYKVITSKKTKKVFQFFPQNIISFILFILLLIVFIPQILSNDVRVYNSSIPNKVIDPIIDEKFSQDIDIKKVNKFNKISIIFATYARKNDSIYKLVLYENDKKIFIEKFNTEKLSDNQYYNFNVGNIKVNKNSKYKIELIPIKVNSSNCVTVYVNNVNNKISFRLSNESPWYLFVIILSVIYLIVFCFINYLINNKIIKKESSFLLLMLVYILSILFITPAVEVPDETYHFYKSYSLSKYNFSKSPTDNFYNQKISVSKNINCLYYADAESKDNVDDVDKFLSCFKNSSEKKYQIPANVSNTQTFAYVPSAIIIKATSLFTNSPIILFYLGRLINLLIGFSVVYYALKIIPKYKNLLLIVVCIPMFIQQMISYSYDCLLNSCCILLIAYLVKFYSQKEQISNKELTIYFLTSFLILHIKFLYFLLSLLIFIVPNKKFKNGLKTKVLSCSMYFIITICLYFVFSKLAAIGRNSSDVGMQFATPDSEKQIRFLIEHPFSIIRIAYHTIKIQSISYLQSLIGCFGWFKFKLNYIFVWAYYFMLIAATLSSKRFIKNSKSILFVFFIIVLILSCIFGGMYIGWSKYMLPYVEGVQGRYFIPFILPLLLICIPKNIKIRMSNSTIYSFLNIIFIAYIYTLLVSFY